MAPSRSPAMWQARATSIASAPLSSGATPSCPCWRLGGFRLAIERGAGVLSDHLLCHMGHARRRFPQEAVEALAAAADRLPLCHHVAAGIAHPGRVGLGHRRALQPAARDVGVAFLALLE